MKWPSLPAVLLLLVVVFVVCIRIRLLTNPLERDEGEFAYGGQLMLQGIPPYKLFYNMKFPGIYAAYALAMRIFGQSPAGIHLGLLVVNLLGIFLLYRVALRFLHAPSAAITAASYALLSASPVVLGLAAHATQFVVPAALAGWLALCWAEESGKTARYFLSGFLMGMACLMKQPGAMFGLFGLCLLVLHALRQRNEWRVHVPQILLYSIGGAAPLLIAALVLWRSGVWTRFWFWGVLYAKVHATEYPISAAWPQLTDFFGAMPLLGDGLFWIVAGLGLISLFLVTDDIWKKISLTAFCVFSAIAVSGSYYFSPHYFVMFLPAICILTGCAFSGLSQWLGKRNLGGFWKYVPPGVLFLMMGLVILSHREIFLFLSPRQVCQRTYSPNPFVETEEIGRWIRQHSSDEARIAVLGSEPELFFYAHRHSATGYNLHLRFL